jgi:succinate-semialdehyde dehydrogenase/glutarate-semialdehyde dehydrogenase
MSDFFEAHRSNVTSATTMTETNEFRAPVVEAINLKDRALLRTQAFIAGTWKNADDGSTFEVRNPATGGLVAAVPKMGSTETGRAIEAAKVAWRGWRTLPAKARAVVLRRWYELMIENVDDLAHIMTAEQGKPLAEAKSEIRYAASFL